MNATMFTAFIQIVFVYSMERFPGRQTKHKSDILTKRKKMDDVGYLFSIGEDEIKTLDEEMWEAILHAKRFELEKIRTQNWQCKKVKKIYVGMCNEWKRRWTSLTVYLAYYSEFGRQKMGTKMVKALGREKPTADRQWHRQQMAQQLEETGMLDHLAIKPHFKAHADGSMLTFTEAIGQCFSAYNALFGSQKGKFCHIYQCFCDFGGPNDEAPIRPPSEFVNEKECVYVNEWVRAYKRAKTFGDIDLRRSAQLLLSSMVPMIENDQPIPAELLRFSPPVQLPTALN